MICCWNDVLSKWMRYWNHYKKTYFKASKRFYIILYYIMHKPNSHILGYRIVNLWNLLPEEVANSTNSFKNVSICCSKTYIIVNFLKTFSGWAIAHSRTRLVYRQYAYFDLMVDDERSLLLIVGGSKFYVRKWSWKANFKEKTLVQKCTLANLAAVGWKPSS